MKRVFAFIVALVIVLSVSITAFASNAVEVVYSNGFSSASDLDGWSVFGTSSNSMTISSERAENGTSLKLSNHSQSWYSPRMNITSYLYEHGYRTAGTYTIKLWLGVSGLSQSSTNARIILRSTSGNNGGYSFVKNYSGNYYATIGTLTKVNNNSSVVLTASFSMNDEEALLNNPLYLCVDSIAGAAGSSIYIDNVAIYKNSSFYIDNGDFSQGMAGWRSWGGPGEFTVTSGGYGRYAQDDQYSSIGCNINQILDYYGRAEYTISFRMRLADSSFTGTKLMIPYLTKDESYHYRISPVLSLTNQWQQYDVKINMFAVPEGKTSQLYDILDPENSEVFFRMQMFTAGYPFTYEIDDVKIYRDNCIEEYSDTSKFGERYVSGLRKMAVNGSAMFEKKGIGEAYFKKTGKRLSWSDSTYQNVIDAGVTMPLNRIDYICAIYESADDINLVDDSGGSHAYGRYQFTNGIATKFVTWMGEHSEYYNLYNQFKSGDSILGVGTAKFRVAWLYCGNNYSELFSEAQYNFAVEKYYQPVKNRINEYLNSFTEGQQKDWISGAALSNIVFAYSIQYGVDGATEMFKEAVENLLKETDCNTAYEKSVRTGKLRETQLLQLFTERASRTYNTSTNAGLYMNAGNDQFAQAMNYNGRWIAKYAESGSSVQIAIAKRVYGMYFDALFMYYQEEGLTV